MTPLRTLTLLLTFTGWSVFAVACDESSAGAGAASKPAGPAEAPPVDRPALTDDPDTPVEVGDLTHDPPSWDGRRIVVRGRARPFGGAIELVDPAPRKALRVMLAGEFEGQPVGCVRKSEGSVSCTPKILMGEVYDVTGVLRFTEHSAYELVPEAVAPVKKTAERKPAG